jgi:hypothetical protein
MENFRALKTDANLPLIVDCNSKVTFHNVTGTGELQWISFHYKVNNPEGIILDFVQWTFANCSQLERHMFS